MNEALGGMRGDLAERLTNVKGPITTLATRKATMGIPTLHG